MKFEPLLNSVVDQNTWGYRIFWRTLWAGRVNDTQAVASGRSNYVDKHITAIVADAVAALELTCSDSLLDIGCAKGLMGDRLRPMVSRYVGMDYIPGFRPVVVGDAVALPFKDCSFSKTLMSGVLVCIPVDLNGQALREMRRVTKSGGRGFISGNPEVYQHKMHPNYRREGLMALALESGWAKASIAPITPVVDQSHSCFDMVVEA